MKHDSRVPPSFFIVVDEILGDPISRIHARNARKCLFMAGTCGTIEQVLATLQYIFMRISQIIQSVDNLSAGPTYSVAKMADELQKLGEDVSVLTLGKPPKEWPYETTLRVHDGIFEQKVGVSFSLMREIRMLSGSPCILHGHSIWRLANLFPLLLSRESPARIVCSPRGTLSPWSMQHKALVKQPFWHMLQKPSLLRCHCLHATSFTEFESIRDVGLRVPVAIIPNGVDIPDAMPDNNRARRVLFLGRIDPVKGVDMLLSAWTAIAAEFNDWELVIAGRPG
jgi:glycosyltransferase involved in cell wall biosynthesis